MDRTAVRVTIEGAERFQRLLPGVPATCGMKSGAVLLQPGESVGEHAAGGREEAIIVLAGQAEVIIAGRPAFTAGRHELVYIPPETVHDIANNGAVALLYVYVVAPVNKE